MPPFPPVDSRDDIGLDELMAALAGLQKPTILKGLVRHWPAVAQAQQGADALIDYLKACDNGTPAETLRQMPGGDGRFFYGEAQQGFNFQRGHIPLKLTLERLRAQMNAASPEPIYIQSAELKTHMPRFKAENRLELAGVEAEPRIWIGNRSLTQTHFDVNYNLVCMVGGHKRFVLFPPQQTPNLYMGPIEVTVSGVPTSMASLENPDFAAHPRFAEALKAASVADLEPGDALYIPYMWWHHVASTTAFNCQVNYWWNTAGAEMGVPMQALLHAMLSLRDLPPDQNAAWQAMFAHFVFGQTDTAAHLPTEARGLLGDISPQQRQAIRAALGRNLQD